MSLEGHIHNGMVIFTQPVPLPEGTRVRVEAVSPEPPVAGGNASLLEQLGDVVGAIDDLPEDLAENQDHYLYKTAKRR